MAKKELVAYSLDEMKDKYIGKIGTAARDEYENKLCLGVLKYVERKAKQPGKNITNVIKEIEKT